MTNPPDLKLLRTQPTHPDFVELITLLDADLAITDGDEHAFYDQFNKTDHINHALLAYRAGAAVGCGAIKKYDREKMEVKRMYVRPSVRGQNIAGHLLEALEKWAAELGYRQCILETGSRQTAAIRLYEKHGYVRRENYGQYAGVANSICFEKTLG